MAKCNTIYTVDRCCCSVIQYNKDHSMILFDITKVADGCLLPRDGILMVNLVVRKHNKETMRGCYYCTGHQFFIQWLGVDYSNHSTISCIHWNIEAPTSNTEWSILNQNIETWSVLQKTLSNFIEHFVFIQNVTECFWVYISQQVSIIKLMVWCQASDKPLPESMMTQFSDA